MGNTRLLPSNTIKRAIVSFVDVTVMSGSTGTVKSVFVSRMFGTQQTGKTAIYTVRRAAQFRRDQWLYQAGLISLNFNKTRNVQGEA